MKVMDFLKKSWELTDRHDTFMKIEVHKETPTTVYLKVLFDNFST